MAAEEDKNKALGLSVELRDVVFGYDKSRPVLKGVSLFLPAGSSAAVVGPSGSGKSTLLRLLLRAYDVDTGSILLNGVDVRDLRAEALRGAVAAVPQDTALMSDTLAANIAYGRMRTRSETAAAESSSGASSKEIEAAARGRARCRRRRDAAWALHARGRARPAAQRRREAARGRRTRAAAQAEAAGG